MSKVRVHQRKIFRFLLFFVILTGSFLLLNNITSASSVSNIIPSDGSKNVVSADTATGGSFSSPSSYVYLYVPITNPIARATVQDITNGELYFVAIQRKTTSGCTSVGQERYIGDYTGFSSNQTVGFTNIRSDTERIDVNRNGTLTTYNVYCVHTATSRYVSGGSSNVTYRVSTDSGNFLGAFPGLEANKGTGYFRVGVSRGSTWSMSLDFATPCGNPVSGPANPIRLYDLDNGYSQPASANIEVWLQAWDRNNPNVLIGGVQLKGRFNASTGLEDVRYSRDGFGIPLYRTEGWYPSAYSNNYTWEFWPRENFPSNNDLPYSEDHIYRLGIIGIGWQNKIRVRLPFDQFNAVKSCPDRNPNPIGFADSCRLEGGRTVIYGWSYDADSANTSQPPVRVRVSGRPDQDVATPYNYRTSEINNWLNTMPAYASGPKDNRYGFRAEYNNLYKGNTFSLSGTLLNVGPGVAQTMGINQATGPPGGGVAGSYGFPGAVIPQQCLADQPMPSCIVTPIPSEVQINQSFDFQVQMIADPAGAYTVSSIAYSSNPNIGGGTYTVPGSSQTISGGNRTFTVSNSLSTPNVGDVRLSATANTNFGAVPCSNNATAGSTITFIREPYVRTYGNDVSVGRGFWNTTTLNCPSGTGDVLGHGGFTGSTRQTNYRGAAAQLAVFAAGQIEGVLPGSQFNRNPNNQLGFAASGVNLANLQFGGNLPTGSLSCIYNYYDDRPTGSPTPVSLVDLSTLPSGTYHYTSQTAASDVLLSTFNRQISNKLVIYVEGDVYLATNGGSSIALVDAWASTDNIPSLYVIASGDIYTSYSLSRIDGTFVSQGEIHTCSYLTSLGSGRYRANNLISPSVNQSVLAAQGSVSPPVAGCQQKLFVYGSLIANKVNFLRSNGTQASGVPTEGPVSANVAEVLQFTPEVYLNDGGGLPLKTTDEVSIDSIVSLPPSF